MEKSFLYLSEETKKDLQGIKVDRKLHKERGKRVAKEIVKRSSMITEDSYKNKIKKYHLYKYILNFDYDMKKNIDKKIAELNKKIEKTYNIDIRGNRYFSNYVEDYLYNNLDQTYFKIRERNPDTTLYIDIDDFMYLEPKTTVKTFPRNYKKKIKNSNNQETIENTTYYENNYSKRTKLEFFISYKLVSNISGEVLFENKKHIDKKYEKKWKTYYFSPFTNSKGINIPDDEEEKEVPSKYEIVSEVLKTIHKYIELDFDNLEKIKD
ncbi:MAG: hypothetical protein KGV57_04155 [Fusobacterium sp.]|nr:hypothetical protein [Fusobacterium sp.]